MYDPMIDCFQSPLFLQQGALVAKEFHRQFVVGQLKERSELLAEYRRRRRDTRPDAVRRLQPPAPPGSRTLLDVSG